jgi:adenylate kinase family enzyme
MRELTAAAMDAGVAGVMVAPPGTLRTDDSILAYCRLVAETLGPDGIDLAVDLDVPLEVVKERIAGRARADDSPEAVERRLRDYEEKTVPAVQWFGSIGKLVEVDGLGTEDEVFERLAHVIDTHI